MYINIEKMENAGWAVEVELDKIGNPRAISIHPKHGSTDMAIEIAEVVRKRTGLKEYEIDTITDSTISEVHKFQIFDLI